MAFTGTATVVLVSDRMVRITGVSLAASAVGTIGLTGATGTAPDITLPATFVALAYTFQGATIALTSGIRIDVLSEGTAALTNLPTSVAKTGTTVATWRTTITNTNSGTATQALEIWVEFLGGGKIGFPTVIGP